jgi:hypothetical protein
MIGTAQTHCVNLTRATCTEGGCYYWLQMKIPCRHAIAAAKHLGLLGGGMLEWYKTSVAPGFFQVNYTAALTQACISLVDVSTLEEDGTTLPPGRRAQSGRPQLKRWRKRGEKVIHGVRQPGVDPKKYYCSICGGAGHTKATCKIRVVVVE